MIECPSCGMENAAGRAFCAVCGQQLPTQPTEESVTTKAASASSPHDEVEDWLLTEDEGPSSANQALPGWLSTNKNLNSPPAVEPEEATTEQDVESEVAEEVTSEHLPAWLQGVKIKSDPISSDTVEWDDDLDFSDLPDWPLDEMPEVVSGTDKRESPPDFSELREDDLFKSAENEGTGLLAGIMGPIPIEPVITVDHEAPAFPTQPEISENTTSANLFAQIAGGAVVQEPLALPAKPLRGVALLQLILLLVIIIPLTTPFSLLGAPPLLPATSDFGEVIANSQGVVLLAFDYEGNMSDELEPAAIATLKHLADVAEGGNGEFLTLLTVSTMPQGPALAERAWAASQKAGKSTNIKWENLGYLPGGSIGLRSLLAERLLADDDMKISIEELSLIIVMANETTYIQRWIEQIGAEMDELPMLAVAPATTETTLMPYLASSQLDGLLAGIPGTASYEYYSARQSGMALRRIDSVSLGALLVVIVIVAGNVMARRAEKEE